MLILSYLAFAYRLDTIVLANTSCDHAVETPQQNITADYFDLRLRRFPRFQRAR